MAVDAADVAELRRMLAENGEANRGDDLRALQTYAEVLGYVVSCARQAGVDEVDAVELVVRATDMPREDIRAAERVLRPLGYTKVANKLRELAKRARRRPEPYWLARLPLAPRHRHALN
jgi:hypothetical protein